MQKFEGEATFGRVLQLHERPIIGNFDRAHLQAIHKHIFQDVFEWAGKLRTVKIAKPRSPFFAFERYLVPSLDKLASQLKAQGQLRGLTMDEFAIRAARIHVAKLRFPRCDRVRMNAVLAAELNERQADVMFSEDRDDLRPGEARLAHMSFFFGLSARETHDFKWPGLPGQRQVRNNILIHSLAKHIRMRLAGMRMRGMTGLISVSAAFQHPYGKQAARSTTPIRRILAPSIRRTIAR